MGTDRSEEDGFSIQGKRKGDVRKLGRHRAWPKKKEDEVCAPGGGQGKGEGGGCLKWNKRGQGTEGKSRKGVRKRGGPKICPTVV